MYQQKLAEGQEIAEAVLDAEVRLGELRKRVPREKGGRPEKTIHHEVQSFDSQLKTFDEKAQLTRRIAPQIEAIASHPDLVERVKAEKREAGEIVTRQDVLNAIKAEEQASREPQAPQEAPWLHRRMFSTTRKTILHQTDLSALQRIGYFYFLVYIYNSYFIILLLFFVIGNFPSLFKSCFLVMLACIFSLCLCSCISHYRVKWNKMTC